MTKHILVVMLITLALLLPACSPGGHNYYTDGGGGHDAGGSTPLPPQSPSGLAAEAVSQTQVDLAWGDNSNNEVGFKIYRDGNCITTRAANTTSFQDVGLEAGTSYRYIVRAYNAAGESGASSCSVTTLSPAVEVNVTIDYMGVRNAHGGNVQLVVVVSDGDKIEKTLIPPVEEGFSMSNFEVRRIDQHVFHTPSVQGDLKINILAYHRDQSKTDYLAMIQMMEWYYGDSINVLKHLIENMPENDELIGYCDQTMYSDESWGIGQYSGVGHGDDFLVWFSIWSDKKPPLVPEPSLLPDVEIHVEMPPEVVQSNSGWWYFKYYTNTVTIVNNEQCAVEVQWKAVTSANEEFDGTVTVPGGGKYDVSERYFYENDIGPLDWTYTIWHNGKQLDSWYGTMNVIPGPYS